MGQTEVTVHKINGGQTQLAHNEECDRVKLRANINFSVWSQASSHLHAHTQQQTDNQRDKNKALFQSQAKYKPKTNKKNEGKNSSEKNYLKWRKEKKVQSIKLVFNVIYSK